MRLGGFINAFGTETLMNDCCLCIPNPTLSSSSAGKSNKQEIEKNPVANCNVILYMYICTYYTYDIVELQ